MLYGDGFNINLGAAAFFGFIFSQPMLWEVSDVNGANQEEVENMQLRVYEQRIINLHTIHFFNNVNTMSSIKYTVSRIYVASFYEESSAPGSSIQLTTPPCWPCRVHLVTTASLREYATYSCARSVCSYRQQNFTDATLMITPGVAVIFGHRAETLKMDACKLLEEPLEKRKEKRNAGV